MTLCEAIEILEKAEVPSPAYDAKELFYHFGKIKRPALIFGDTALPDEVIRSAVMRRSEREPLQYIIGEVSFYREAYSVTPDVLIPRSDTEILVDYAVHNIPKGEAFLDICTGSGCIAISVLNNTKNTHAEAVDISDGALSVARINAERNNVAERLSIKRKDALEYTPSEKVFAVLANPPYVTAAEYLELDAEIYREPRNAFVGGEDGLDFYRKIVPNCLPYLKDGGFFAFEIGYLQRDGITKIAEKNGLTAEILKDFSNNDRVAVLRQK